ncbi:MAG: ABC transporter permease [Phycisphaerales bacterium]|nr:MAG: ABC transporter permease [Phycisphaerales bacterium]
MQYWALLVDSFRESRDRKIFWLMLVISIMVAGAMLCVGFEPGKVTFLFGMWEHETSYFTDVTGLKTDLIAGIVVDGIMDTVLGWIGVTLAIIATAGLFPSWMERGAIDVVVSKPIARWELFLGRYLGGLAFVLFQATVFVLLTFLVAGVRWGTWLPGYLLAIPLVVLLFSYLYCVSVSVAVVFRSTVAAILLTLVVWISFTGVQTLDDLVTFKYTEWQEQRSVYRSVHLARWIVPKTQDMTHIAKKWSGAAPVDEFLPEPAEEDRANYELAARIEAARMALNPVYTIGSSLLFEVVLLILAMWRFSRMDF